MVAFAPQLERLTAFPFRRLAALLADVRPPAGLEPVDLALGEPQDPPPALLARTVADHAHLWNRYPPPQGTPEFRRACVDWLVRRYRLPEGLLDPERHVLPLCGTKEGLFLAAALVAGRPERPLALLPDPLYGVYYGAAVTFGLEPRFLPATAASGFLPDLDGLDAGTLARTAVFYVCTPYNPTGAVADRAWLRRVLRLAHEHGFLLIVDECYAEIYDAEPPPGALEVAAEEPGGLRNLLVFHSLSKRSSAPGLRSGFACGDPEAIARFLHLRAYGGAVQPLPLMAAATALWRDEVHVVETRERYRQRFAVAERILGGRFGFRRPPGGFFLWLDVEDGERAAVRLWREAAIRVLPGTYLGAGPTESSPARRYVRLAMVHDADVTARALERFVAVLG